MKTILLANSALSALQRSTVPKPIQRHAYFKKEYVQTGAIQQQSDIQTLFTKSLFSQIWCFQARVEGNW